MKKRFTWIISLIVIASLFLALPLSGYASSTAEVKEPLDTAKACSLDLTFANGDLKFSGKEISLYRVATVDQKFNYALADAFVSLPIRLAQVKSDSEYTSMAQTLYGYIVDGKLEANAKATTDSNGKVKFESLPVGIYLVTPMTAVENDVIYTFDAQMISVPGVGNDGKWIYNVTALPKSSTKDVEKAEYKIVVSWDDEGNQDKRPESIDFNIYKDGELFETVTLSEENNWSFVWNVVDHGEIWTVAERGLPENYVTSVVRTGNIFSVTNTYVLPPVTGENTTVVFWALVALVLSAAVVMTTVLLKKKSN